MEQREKYLKAAQAIKKARAIVVTAGAGMGVDSGLPDFRGDQGFWKAYPMYERLGLSFVAAANPSHFQANPAFGWGFYGHRTNLYRRTLPHHGFTLLLNWISRYRMAYFVATSNVDGQFQKAGFHEDNICEIHGSIHYLQCVTPCLKDIWENNETIPVDFSTMLASHIPQCPYCGGTARPNILMFNDYNWNDNRTARQERNLTEFLRTNRQKPMVVIEIGAGTAIPTIRNLSERLGRSYNATVIRLNPREPFIPDPHISLACGAMAGLSGIDEFL